MAQAINKKRERKFSFSDDMIIYLKGVNKLRDIEKPKKMKSSVICT